MGGGGSGGDFGSFSSCSCLRQPTVLSTGEVSFFFKECPGVVDLLRLKIEAVTVA